MEAKLQEKIDRPQAIQALLSAESPIRAEKRSYQPPLCAILQQGPGIAQPMPGAELEVLKAAQE